MVLVFTLGYQSPAALINVLRCLVLVLSSASTPETLPHSANWRKPSVAMCSRPQKENPGSWEAPIKSLKCVSQAEKGKSLGWVVFDQIPSKIIYKTTGGMYTTKIHGCWIRDVLYNNTIIKTHGVFSFIASTATFFFEFVSHSFGGNFTEGPR